MVYHVKDISGLITTPILLSVSAATSPGTTVLDLLWLNDVKIPTRRGRFWKAKYF